MSATTLQPHGTSEHEAGPEPARRPASLLREHAVVLAATAAVMLHIADDNFLQPARGVHAADHLLSGLVPLAVLATLAIVSLRVRAGARAVIALVISLTGLVTGPVEAGNHILADGPYGDDFSGLVAALAGLVLAGWAAHTLWRSRRTDGSRTRRYVRRTALAIGGCLVLGEIAGPFMMSYVITHVARVEVPAPDLGAEYEDVTLTTSDGLRLEGWYVPSRNGAAVIAFPGRKGPQAHTRMLVRHGYGVLLFDRRGEGASEGDGNMLGWGGARDIHAAVDFLQERPDVDPERIGGIGFSVGGELMLEAAADDAGLAAVVSEGAGTRTLEEELVEYDAPTVIRGFHALLAKQAGARLFSNERPPVSLVELAPKIAPRPTLLIWAPNGGNRETMNPLYQRLIGPSAEIWEIDDARHIKGLQTHPDEYERRVIGFFDRALLEKAGANDLD